MDKQDVDYFRSKVVSGFGLTEEQLAKNKVLAQLAEDLYKIGTQTFKCPMCGEAVTRIDLLPDTSPVTGKPYQYAKLMPCGHDMGKES